MRNILFYRLPITKLLAPAVVALISLFFHSVIIAQTITLDSGWQFRQLDSGNWLPAIVPGCVHTDLLENGLIPDPFYRMNEQSLQWIDKKDWEYMLKFDLPPEIYEREHIELCFEGLDTYADVWLNGHKVLSADNMFRNWVVGCRNFLKPVGNSLRIVFHSPVNKGLRYYDSLDYVIPVSGNDMSELGGLGNKRVSIFTRKAPYQYGWDWGPRLVTSGIWRNVYLQGWDRNIIRDLFIRQDSLIGSNVYITMLAEIQSDAKKACVLELSMDDKPLIRKTINTNPGLDTVAIPILIENIQRWWPNGSGEQKLYAFKAVLMDGIDTISEMSARAGFRTVELVQESDSAGRSFYFKVNGVPVFMKGANYIPQDIFPSRVDTPDYRFILQSARDANMNMIRVWGGGIYENNLFYELCDELGLLVWQDFMFACSMYPGDDGFLENVRQEAADNIRRLRNHPCMGLWCGNNENFQAWEAWGWKEETIKNYSEEVAGIIWKAYDTLFHNLLPAEVARHHTGMPYWPSSPGSAWGRKNDFRSGDNHYWMVWWGGDPFAKYKTEIGRFMSEYGFQSFPEMSTIRKFTLTEDLDIYSPVMQSHQRSSIGNKTIEDYMLRDFRKPIDFPMFLYVSQALQAMGIKTAIEAHRRSMPYCMGSLYWQLNDCWPVASWSGIDYYGRWKALHFTVKNSFSNILVFSEVIQKRVDDPRGDVDPFSLNKLKTYIISDNLNNIKIEFKLELIDFEGHKLWGLDTGFVIPANSSQNYYTMNMPDQIRNREHQTLLYASISDSAGRLLSENVCLFKAYKDLTLPDPGISKEISEIPGGYAIRLKSQAFAPFVLIENDVAEGEYSDNYFDLLPGREKIVVFKTDAKIDLTVNPFRVISLRDSYTPKSP